MKISIVGGGASGIAILRHLADLALQNPNCNPVDEIQMYDKSGFDGGVAYRTESDHHLLNMKMSTMSIRVGEPQDFTRWAARVGLSCDCNDHLPRKVYRRYLEDARQSAIEHCRQAGISVHVEHAEVIGMRFFGALVVLETADHVERKSSVAVLCTGHNAPDDHYGLSASANFIRDPYGAFAFPNRESIEIGILGTGLTAVDSLVALASTHPSIALTCFSRSGLFPTVQSTTLHAPNDGFRKAIQAYIASGEQIGADALAGKISELLQVHAGIRCDLSCRSIDGDALADIERNIVAAQSGRPNVSSVLTGIADVICDAWNRMNRTEKARFMDVYSAGWLRNRSAMPLANAVKIRDLLRSGQLSTISRLRDVVDIGGSFRAAFGDGGQRDLDYVIAATGPSYHLNRSALYQDMARQGIVALEGLGGISCDYTDGRVHDAKGGKHHNVYAVGSPTKATYFYAAAVDINLRRAEAVVNAILRDAQLAPPRWRSTAELAEATG
jgi:uncharacterized NAD(P)/FAD-binding protein YdhS